MSTLFQTLATLLKLLASCTSASSDDAASLDYWTLNDSGNVQITLSAQLSAADQACWTDHLKKFEAFDMPAGGCDYGNVVFNDDYKDTPADCAKKGALCLDASVHDCTYGTPEQCIALFDHCSEWSSACYAEIALDL